MLFPSILFYVTATAFKVEWFATSISLHFKMKGEPLSGIFDLFPNHPNAYRSNSSVSFYIDFSKTLKGN